MTRRSWLGLARYTLLFYFALLTSVAAEDFSFDISAFEKKPFEWGGFLELDFEHLDYNQDSTIYQINFADQPKRSTSDRYIGRIELNTAYTKKSFKASLTAHTDLTDDETGSDEDTALYEALVSYQSESRTTLEIGKKAIKWGKGYAWSPVGFVERAKDPNDPTLSREGYVMVTGDYIVSGDGDLKTIAFTPVILPVSDNLNDDYSKEVDTNIAAKLYLLYRDVDIDFVVLGKGSLSTRYGADISFNVSSNFELHGEWAYVSEMTKTLIDTTGSQTLAISSANSFLLGLRYLTEQDTTYIAEYYYNEGGYSEDELRNYYRLIHDESETNPSDLSSGYFDQLSKPYQQRTPGQQYFYLRASNKEPFNILYLTSTLTVIVNLQDQSYSVAPEVIYTRFNNIELLLKATLLRGEDLSEFAEKMNDRKWELRAKYFF